MRTRLLPIVVPAVLAVLFTSGGLTGNTIDQSRDPAEVLRQLGVPDSIARQWVEPYIPLWALTQEAPIVGPDGPVSGPKAAASVDCPPSLEIELISGVLAHHFDSARGVSELYNRDHIDHEIIRYDVADDLSYSTSIIPFDDGGFRLVEDLDRDGDAEIVSQSWGNLLIRSSSDGLLLGTFEWPGHSAAMYPTAFNLDDDSHLEIYVTPHPLGGSARAVIIDYDSSTGGFLKLVDIASPTNLAGPPAIGDFDEDGRMEFISGNNDNGYELFEWQEPNLVYIGMVGDITDGNNFSATACRPFPGGVLHALLGHSSSSNELGFRYQLLEPTGDNTFEVIHVFQERTGFMGIHPCMAADTDCDGLDELVMSFHPTYRVWEWDGISGSFVEGCNWLESTYSTLVYWYAMDLNQNGASEWGTAGHDWIFRAFPDPDCMNCDSAGLCTPPDPSCYCGCASDPECDGKVDVLDVVGAVNVAFRNSQSDPDPFAQCPVKRTDADCNTYTDVLDVVRFVNVAFRNADPTVEFCDPCAP